MTPDDLIVHGLPPFRVHGLLLGVFGRGAQGRGCITPCARGFRGGSREPLFRRTHVVPELCLSGNGDAAELIEFVARTLSAHNWPREIRFVAELPCNAMGNVQKEPLGRG